MSDVKATMSVPKEVLARLKEFEGRDGFRVDQLPLVTSPVRHHEIVDMARDVIPRLDISSAEMVAVLDPAHPVIGGVARLDMESVTYYSTDTAAPYALIGSFSQETEFPPFLRLTLEGPVTGFGMLVTCRAWGGSVGPNYPGYYRVEGPGVAASFEDIGYPTTFTFFVPARAESATEIKIYTDFDRIKLWGFYDLTLTQV